MAQTTNSANQKVFVTQSGIFVAHEKDDVLGRGTYGVVYRAHLETDPSVKKAIKIFSPDTMDESEGIPSTTLREINALRTIFHPNVMTAEEVVIPEKRSLTDMFFVMMLCKGTLKDKMIDLIRIHLDNDPKWLAPTKDMKLPNSYIQDVKIIVWQLLNSLAVVHSRGIIHRDLKPVNILWGFDDLLKLADFGLARFVRGNQNSDQSMLQQTGEVQTMWYRAPEVLLGDEKYGLLVDDWSLGCVIAELFRFRRNSAGRMEPAPLFQGRSDIGTLMIIFETLGTPTPDIKSEHSYLGKLKYWSKEYPQWTQGTIRERIPLLDEQGHEMLQQLLQLSPTERRASRFLLKHPWFEEVQPLLKDFVPWYRGFELDYQRMVAVDRMPLPKRIRDNQNQTTNVQTNENTNPQKAVGLSNSHSVGVLESKQCNSDTSQALKGARQFTCSDNNIQLDTEMKSNSVQQTSQTQKSQDFSQVNAEYDKFCQKKPQVPVSQDNLKLSNDKENWCSSQKESSSDVSKCTLLNTAHTLPNEPQKGEPITEHMDDSQNSFSQGAHPSSTKNTSDLDASHIELEETKVRRKIQKEQLHSRTLNVKTVLRRRSDQTLKAQNEKTKLQRKALQAKVPQHLPSESKNYHFDNAQKKAFTMASVKVSRNFPNQSKTTILPPTNQQTQVSHLTGHISRQKSPQRSLLTHRANALSRTKINSPRQQQLHLTSQSTLPDRNKLLAKHTLRKTGPRTRSVAAAVGVALRPKK